MTTSFNLTKLAHSVSDLLTEGESIISRLGKNAENDSRFKEVLSLLYSQGEKGEKAIG